MHQSLTSVGESPQCAVMSERWSLLSEVPRSTLRTVTDYLAKHRLPHDPVGVALKVRVAVDGQRVVTHEDIARAVRVIEYTERRFP